MIQCTPNSNRQRSALSFAAAEELTGEAEGCTIEGAARALVILDLLLKLCSSNRYSIRVYDRGHAGSGESMGRDRDPSEFLANIPLEGHA